jgi:hypothetical protein
MKESGIWTFEVSKKPLDQNILNKRKLSLKGAESDKKIAKLKGLENRSK